MKFRITSKKSFLLGLLFRTGTGLFGLGFGVVLVVVRVVAIVVAVIVLDAVGRAGVGTKSLLGKFGFCSGSAAPSNIAVFTSLLEFTLGFEYKTHSVTIMTLSI